MTHHSSLRLIQHNSDGSRTQRVWLVRDSPTQSIVDAIVGELGEPAAVMLVPADVIADAGPLADRCVML